MTDGSPATRRRSSGGTGREAQLDFSALTDPGRQRADNEDAWFADAERGLFLVSDGMGGQVAGALASKIVVEVLPQMLQQRMGNWPAFPLDEAIETARNSLRELSELVRQRTKGQPGLDGMGATAVLALVHDGRALIAHLGDSRAYLFRAGRLKRLTTDHTIARLLVESGDISEKEVLTHPTNSQLTRFVGMKGEPLPEVKSISLKPRDRLLLCTDGLTRMVNDRKLAALLQKGQSLPTSCTSLVVAANEAGGEDNITAILVSLCGRGILPLASPT